MILERGSLPFSRVHAPCSVDSKCTSLHRRRPFALSLIAKTNSDNCSNVRNTVARAHAVADFENSLKTGRSTAAQPSDQTGNRHGSKSLNTRKKLRVAVDVDEVLGRFVHSLNNFCTEQYGLEYDLSDYHVYDFAQVWRCSQDESNHKVHEFFKSDHFSTGIDVIPGSYDALSRLQEECELMVVTSRQHVIQQPTLEWIETHFPNIFDAVYFGNHFALEGTSRKKSEICHSIGAHVLIDDNPSYALECATAGIHVLLYDWEHQYPWSKTPDGPTHERITRVRNWEEVEQVLAVFGAGYGDICVDLENAG